jgi:hypothetical protein
MPNAEFYCSPSMVYPSQDIADKNTVNIINTKMSLNYIRVATGKIIWFIVYCAAGVELNIYNNDSHLLKER